MNTRAILSFICDEVTRQGHDIEDECDGWPRVVWMVNAWREAVSRKEIRPSQQAIVTIACTIEPVRVHGYRNCNVRVGSHVCPPHREVEGLVNGLWARMDELTPDEFYVEFEKIHPFVDGNGRTGKILHNWLLGTLHDPVLIKDYFGGGNP